MTSTNDLDFYVNNRIQVKLQRRIFREYLKVILISASNSWSSFLLVVLLGYGLVEVPRQFWQMGNRGIFIASVSFMLLIHVSSEYMRPSVSKLLFLS